MNNIIKRRIRNTLSMLAIVTLIGLMLHAQEASLQRSAFTSGYILLVSILFLAAYNIRKKLPFLPLGTSAAWLQLHIYVALGTIALFAMHIGFQLPDGRLEFLLAALYVIVAASGVYGLYVSRTVPKKLTAIREEVIFERIPAIRNQVSAEVRQLVMDSAGDSTLFADFYQDRLLNFFEGSRGTWYYLFPSGHLRRKLLTELQDMNRYLTDSQQIIGKKLSSLVNRKDDVDYHYVMQGRLKIWLFAHIGFTYSLIAAGLLHAILAHAFHGAMR